MHNVLVEQLLRVRLANGSCEAMSLPEVYSALATDVVEAFPALRVHQRHAWHAFLAQLGVIAMFKAECEEPPAEAREWQSLLRGLTPNFGNDEPWRLVVEDYALPAFLQCPTPTGLASYPNQVSTPDDLDILVNSKNHEIKQAVAVANAPEDWIYALIDLQTMGGYFGRKYGIARMNRGFSARPCLGLAPASGRVGAHVFHDMREMLRGREGLLDSYPDYFQGDLALVWLAPWDGTDSLELRELDPYFIEICRRVRLSVTARLGLFACTVPSKVRRIAAEHACGDLGDFWVPVNLKDATALSISSVGFRYDRLVELLLDRRKFKLPRAMLPTERTPHWRLVARGVAGGRGGTNGYHERTDIDFSNETVSFLRQNERAQDLAKIAKAQMEEIKAIADALRFGVAVAASGGKSADALTKAGAPYARRLDAVADAYFFSALQDRHQALLNGDTTTAASVRYDFAGRLVKAAASLLEEAIMVVHGPSIFRHRAKACATNAFWGRLRRSTVFSDQLEIITGRPPIEKDLDEDTSDERT